MPDDLQVRGEELIRQLSVLIVDTLKKSPHGLTNIEVERAAGLTLPIYRQRGYISWSILEYLLETGQIWREGRNYYPQI